LRFIVVAAPTGFEAAATAAYAEMNEGH
jgi:hypothetical protein